MHVISGGRGGKLPAIPHSPNKHSPMGRGSPVTGGVNRLGGRPLDPLEAAEEREAMNLAVRQVSHDHLIL
jgi:hypothetical protein